MATILVIDDERMICDLLRSVFSAHGHEVVTATDGREGLKLFRQKSQALPCSISTCLG
jgi:DNA-binding response OmpR family regulator